jgi:hypothetical protein
MKKNDFIIKGLKLKLMIIKHLNLSPATASTTASSASPTAAKTLTLTPICVTPAFLALNKSPTKSCVISKKKPIRRAQLPFKS